jgi:hypothetical protein
MNTVATHLPRLICPVCSVMGIGIVAVWIVLGVRL